ncbi:MAG: hypothetical protein HY656_01995 [Acidobacteria bacterium]|nr:hypothetical protein [Acidobacteriota bacterium]
MSSPPPTDQSLWWLLPGALLSLFLVHAMVEFTAALLAKRPRPRTQPLTAEELRERLFELNDRRLPVRLVPGRDCDFELHCDPVEDSWYEPFARVRFTTYYRARLLLDESTREARWNELMRGSNFFLGFDGWVPRFQFSFWFFMGLGNFVWYGRAYGLRPGFPPQIGAVRDFKFDTAKIKSQVSETITRAGWTFRPVIWWFEATHGGVRFLQALLPGPLWRVSLRRFWAVLYPVSYFLAIGALMQVGGTQAWTPHNLGILAFISAIWWGIWGLLAWMLLGFPAFWRRKARASGE